MCLYFWNDYKMNPITKKNVVCNIYVGLSQYVVYILVEVISKRSHICTASIELVWLVTEAYTRSPGVTIIKKTHTPVLYTVCL